MGQHQPNNLILRGTVLLTLSSLIIKILSAVYRIPFQNLVGNTGFYIYQQVYPLYGLGMTFALSGFPVFISKKVAEQPSIKKKYLIGRDYCYVLVILGISLFLLIEGSAGFLAKLMGDPQLICLIQNVGWMYLLMPFLASGRGFYQGLFDMKKTSYSQLIEQTVRVIVIILAAYWAKKTSSSLYQAGSWAMLGGTFGGLAAMPFFLKTFIKDFSHLQVKLKWSRLVDLAKPLFTEGLLFCLNAALLILLQLIDSFTFRNALQASGVSFDAAANLKGIYDRGQPLVQLGLVVTNSLATSFLPELVKSRQSINLRGFQSKVRKLFQVALLFALAAAAGMSVLMPQINWLLFNDSLGSVTLAVNSLMIPLATLVILDNVLLQSQNRQFRVVLIISAMILLKLILNYPLVFYFGIVGGAAASDLALLAAGLIGGYLVTDIGFSYLKNGNWRKYLAVVVPMIVVVKIVSWLMELIIVQNRFNNIYVLTVSILCGVGIFVGLSIKYKLLDLKIIKKNLE